MQAPHTPADDPSSREHLWYEATDPPRSDGVEARRLSAPLAPGPGGDMLFVAADGLGDWRLFRGDRRLAPDDLGLFLEEPGSA